MEGDCTQVQSTIQELTSARITLNICIFVIPYGSSIRVAHGNRVLPTSLGKPL